MTTYVSAVPLAMVRTIDGGYRNVYRDEEVAGAAVDPDNLERLVRKGFLVEKDETSDDSDGSEGPPAKSANKAAWEAYARSQGATDEDLDGTSKDDLIAAYGDS